MLETSPGGEKGECPPTGETAIGLAPNWTDPEGGAKGLLDETGSPPIGTAAPVIGWY